MSTPWGIEFNKNILISLDKFVIFGFGDDGDVIFFFDSLS